MTLSIPIYRIYQSMEFPKCIKSINDLQSESCYFSHNGRRIRNEDYYIADDRHGIYILTDGMGGYKGGEVASKIAAHACYEYLLKHRDRGNITEDLIDYITLKLREMVVSQPEYRSMGTTLSCLYIQDGYINAINIGDSKIIIVGDTIYQSTDHTYAQQLVDCHFLQTEDYRDHPMRHILTKCLTAKPQEGFKADFEKIPLRSGWNTFLICSDGVMETFTEPETIQLILEEPDIKKLIQTVEQKVLKYSNDNATAIIGKFQYSNSIN